MKSKIIFIYITCPNDKIATIIADHLLQSRLIACANITSNMKSLYHWKGKLHAETETVLLLKTQAIHFKKIEKEILILHPYDSPCIVSLPIVTGSKNYLNWILNETKK